MQRYFINERAQDGQLVLPKAIAHHLTTVLRATVGTPVELVLADHQVYLAKVATTEPETIVKIDHALGKNSELPVDVTILCGLPKTKEKPELIVQKATELGAKRIVFFEAQRSVSHWTSKKQQKKVARLQKIADAAAEQSHRNYQPVVAYYSNLKQALTANPADFRLVAWEESAKQGEKSGLARCLQKIKAHQSLLAIFGPEGGLTAGEVDQMAAAGVQPVGLGPRILRTETAPLYFLTAVSYACELATPVN
ncbi:MULTISPECIES: 16S rRNA (uracil(1498)-N(3))-methyltransferase [Limosilactobacillus]|uniref:Ribosomal RNA small subunit methyltransferase E n=1 Tax=Limosilactobacillus panis DSM 6035 TaxID=1423782 RepID=A0A0R1X749_9LACO|nr:16S rRNA (uracil(1498)-N(3))-methyltransferase [Limosilactobacillus panis]KRM25938.1 RsmE family RNA methyltransferase [Limosilactobacillus panis DSM 6035]